MRQGFFISLPDLVKDLAGFGDCLVPVEGVAGAAWGVSVILFSVGCWA